MFSMTVLVVYWIYEALHEARFGPTGEGTYNSRSHPGWDEYSFAH